MVEGHRHLMRAIVSLVLTAALASAGSVDARGARPRWVFDHRVVDTDRRQTTATLVGRDAEKPVAGRIRLLAPRGRVWISVEPVCFYGHRWVAGGDTVEELTSRGSPILKVLSRGIVPYRSRSTDPDWCRWKVTASAAGGTLVLELQSRSRE